MSKKIKVFHGSIWEGLIPEEPYISEAAFFDLSENKNELKVLFLSENKSVCSLFSDMKFFDSENQLQIMIGGEATLEDKSTVTRRYEVGKKVEYNGDYFDYSCNDERDVLYSKLRENGIKAFVMENDYDTDSGSGNDIAVLDSSIFESQVVKVKKTNGEWSNELSYENAKTHFVKFMNGDLFDDHVSIYEEQHDNNYEEEISFSF